MRGARICLPQDEFASYDAIKVASEHNVSICFGVAANTLWEAMREKGDLKTGHLDPDADRAGNLASLIYMIRCCFAHGPAAPVWRIQRNKYKTRYWVGNKMIDLSGMGNSTPFEYAIHRPGTRPCGC